MSIDTLVLDIEGTVCPISFVKETLFPYFLKQLPQALAKVSFPLQPSTDQDDDFHRILQGLPDEVRSSRDATLEYLNSLVNADVKDPVLKGLQGYVWKKGYEIGELKAPIYQDSIDFIKSYASETKKIYIYSSGSVKAQKLLFGYVNENGQSVDLNSYLSGYYDITTSGFKTDPQSYTKILKDIGKNNGSEVLFLSDNVNEVKAAIAAGMQSYIVRRPGNAPLSQQDTSNYKVIDSLAELQI